MEQTFINIKYIYVLIGGKQLHNDYKQFISFLL